MLRARFSVLVVITTIVLGACGDASPTPNTGDNATASVDVTTPPASATVPVGQTASPAPPVAVQAPATPQPLDVVAQFAGVMGDVTFSAHAELTGTTTIGRTTTVSSGQLDINGLRSHLVITRRTAGHATSVDLVNDGVDLFRSSHGLWFEAGESPDNDLAEAVRMLSTDGLDLGVETRNGRELHHLSLQAPAILPDALELSGATVSSVTPTVDAWVLEDGTPVEIELGASWEQVVARKTVSATAQLDLALTLVGADVAIPAPTQLWKLRTSKRFHYQVAYPDDWEAKAGNSKYLDGYFGFDGRSVFAYRFAAHGVSLNQFSSILTTHTSQLTGWTGAKVQSNRSAKLGSMRARVVEVSGKYQGVKRHWVVYFAVKGGYVYWMELRTDAPTTKSDRALAAQFAGSFSPR